MIINASLFVISAAYSLEVGDAQQILKNSQLLYTGTEISEPRTYFFSHTPIHETPEQTGSHNNTLSSTETIMSYIAIQNAPDRIVNDLSHTFRIREPGEPSSVKVAVPSTAGDLVIIGAAFLTNLAVHEVGHEIVADHVGATGSKLDFFQTRNGKFFLGTSTVEDIDTDSILPYTMGGEFFADLTFEHALQDYRKKPSMFNQSLLLYSGIDFAFYCFYAFYAADDHPEYDPVTISKETGLSRDHLFAIVLAKTMINAYRVFSGEDRVIPYFTVDKHSAALNLAFPFEIPSCLIGDCGRLGEAI